MRGKEKHFYRHLLPYIFSCKFIFKVLLSNCSLGWSITISGSQENLREFDKEFLKFGKCFEENPSMIFKENKVVFYTIHGYGVSQFLQLSVCLFMLHEVVMFLEKDFVVLRQETGMFAVSCVSLTIFPVYNSRMTVLFSFLAIYFLRILMVLPSVWIVSLKNVFFCFKWIQTNYEILKTNQVVQKYLMLLLNFKMSVGGWTKSFFTFYHLWINLQRW